MIFRISMPNCFSQYRSLRRKIISRVTGCLSVLVITTAAHGQNSSLFHQDLPHAGRPVLKLPETSFYYQEVPPPKEIKKHDIVTIIVLEKSQVVNEGELERRKNSFIDVAIKDWLELDNGLDLKPAPQADGDPRLNASLNSQYRTEAELETRDLMQFKISAEVVDVRPNGNLILEARRRIRNNEEILEYSLTGMIRREDVMPDNTVLSEKFAELNVYKRDRGSIFDGYKRGWGLRLYDRFAPF